MDKDVFDKWLEDDGDQTKIFDHNLNADSVVMDLGGYTSKWGEELVRRYNSNLFIVEPIKEFFDISATKFVGNDKVKLMNCGVSNRNTHGVIYLDNDSSSSSGRGARVNVEYKSLDNIIKEFDIKHIDLLQINIEGDEYDVLEHLLDYNLERNINNIQIQFHTTVPNHSKRREEIQHRLKINGFVLKYDYPFVWECWTKAFKL